MEGVVIAVILAIYLFVAWWVVHLPDRTHNRESDRSTRPRWSMSIINKIEDEKWM